MLLFLFHFLVVNIRLIHLFQRLHLIHVRYCQTLHVPIPLHVVDKTFRVLPLYPGFRPGAHCFLFVLHFWGFGDCFKDGEGTMSCVVLHKDLGMLASRNISENLREM